MKYLKMLGLAVLAAAALVAFAAAGTASATTLEIEKKEQNKTVPFTASLAPESSMRFEMTNGTAVNTCTESEFNGDTVPDGDGDYTGTTVNARLVEFYFAKCTKPIAVDNGGNLSIAWIEGTDGTVSSVGAEITVGSPFGTVNCKTGTGLDIGTLAGVATGKATLYVNAVLNCGFLFPSTKWSGEYVFTSPNGLGVIK